MVRLVAFVLHHGNALEFLHGSVADELLQPSHGVVVVPSELEETKNFTDLMHEREIPFILLDSYMPDLKPLSFFGQDSFQSGYFAAKMLMLIACNETEIVLMKQMKNGKVASKQQDNREVGFRHYMRDHFPQIKITVLDLPLDYSKKEYDDIMERFFSSHPQNVNPCQSSPSSCESMDLSVCKRSQVLCCSY